MAGAPPGLQVQIPPVPQHVLAAFAAPQAQQAAAAAPHMAAGQVLTGATPQAGAANQGLTQRRRRQRKTCRKNRRNRKQTRKNRKH
jgi:hypothetical protein